MQTGMKPWILKIHVCSCKKHVLIRIAEADSFRPILSAFPSSLLEKEGSFPFIYLNSRSASHLSDPFYVNSLPFMLLKVVASGQIHIGPFQSFCSILIPSLQILFNQTSIWYIWG